MLIYKVLNHNPIFYSNNLEFIGRGQWPLLTRDSVSGFIGNINDEKINNILGKVHSYHDLINMGWCYAMYEISVGFSKAEYLVINDSFDFGSKIKIRYDIISLIREQKIEDIIN